MGRLTAEFSATFSLDLKRRPIVAFFERTGSHDELFR